MYVDPIVQEVRTLRQNHAKHFGYDAQRILADFQKSEAASQEKKQLQEINKNTFDNNLLTDFSEEK